MKKLLLAIVGIVILSCCFVAGACFSQSEDYNDDGHLHSLNYVASTPATCSDDGNIEYWYCADCGKYFSDAEGNSEIIDKTSVVVAATGHDWGEWTETKAATCTENGLEQRECTACHEIEIDLIEATGHDWADENIIVAATCTHIGERFVTCSECQTSEYQEIPRLEHTYGADDRCTVCGYAEKDLAFYLSEDSEYYIVGALDSCVQKELFIPETYCGLPVSEIAPSGFAHCMTLTKAVIPDHIKKINSGAFQVCSNLKYVEIGDGVLSIEDYAFNTESIETIIIGSNLKTIGERIFSSSSSVDLTVDNSNPTFHSDGNCLIETASKTLVLGFASSEIPSDESVTTIGRNAFSLCDQITFLTIPDNITRIEENAFYNCKNLLSVTFGKHLGYIAPNAFDQCAKIIEIYNLSDLDILYGMYGIQGITGLGTVEFVIGDIYDSLDDKSKISRMGNGVYYYQQLDDVYVIAYDGTEENLVLPSSINGKAYDIFQYAFCYNDTIKTIVIPECVTQIGDWAFFVCRNLKEVTMEGVVNIGQNSFLTCTALEQINVSSCLESIGQGAFNNTGYYNDEDNWENGILYISTFLLTADNYKVSGDVIIKDGTLRIADYAFQYCRTITSVVIPESVLYIGHGAFSECDLLKHVEINGGAIEDSAFVDLDNLRSVYIGKKVSYIGHGAFADCDKLESVIFETDSLKEICDVAFMACVSLQEIEIPDTVTTIGYNVFEATNIANIVIPSTVEVLGEKLEESVAVVSFASFNLDKLTILGDPTRFGSIWVVPTDAIVCVEEQYVEKTREYVDELFGGIYYLSEIYPVGTEIFSNGDYRYVLTNEGAELIRYIGAETHIQVPDTVDGYPVVRIGHGCFDFLSDGTDLSFKEGNIKYAYEQLSGGQKSLYDDMNKSVESLLTNHSSVLFINGMGVIDAYPYAEYGLTQTEAIQAWKAFVMENPSYYFLANTVVADTEFKHFIFIDKEYMYLLMDEQYAVSCVQRQEVSAKIQESLNEIGAALQTCVSDYEKVKYLYDYILEHTTYDWDDYMYTMAMGGGVLNIHAHNIAGVLDGDEDTKSACEGYAETLAFLCNYFGIECQVVTSAEMNHAWNVVKVDGVWYWADPTWDDSNIEGGGEITYFLKGDDFLVDHFAYDNVGGEGVNWGAELPEISNVDYD